MSVRRPHKNMCGAVPLLLALSANVFAQDQPPQGPPPGDGPPPFVAGSGPPGGPPGAPAESGPSEPLVTAAQRLLADYDQLEDKAAVELAIDLSLIDPCLDGGSAAFCPASPATRADVETAVERASRLISNAGLAGAHLQMPTAGEAVLESAASVGDAAAALGLDSLENPDTDLSRGKLAQMLAEALLSGNGSAQLPEVRYRQPVGVREGDQVLDNVFVFEFGGSAVQNSGESSLVVRNSRIVADTSTETRPLSGPPGGLLVAGSIRATLALGQAQAYYLNSSVVTKDWAAWSTDGAVPVTADGQRELSVYTYGSTAETVDGGYGVYSDLFCNTYLYGTDIRSAEVGIISGSYGRVEVGRIEDGEGNPRLAAVLNDDDRARQPDKDRASTVIAGRNAILIHSVSLPPYWAYDGYSQAEFPLHVAPVSIRGGRLQTDMSLEKGAPYTPVRHAYIDHVAGSTILIRSSNANLALEGVELLPDERGSGAVLHTVINNDISFIVTVPDGETYQGNHVSMRDMDVNGDVLNEDYQRDLYLNLADSSLSGRIVSGTVEDWNDLAESSGFAEYIIDPDGYVTRHGVHLALDSGSSWIVTGKSSLVKLEIAEGAVVSAKQGDLLMTVDGQATPVRPGAYVGNIRLQIP